MTPERKDQAPAPVLGTTVAGRRPVLEAIRSGEAREVLIARSAGSSRVVRDLRSEAEAARIPVRDVPRSDLDRLAANHQGVVGLVAGSVPEQRAHGERELARRTWGPEDLVVVLDGITDPQNLGAAARSAEAAGAALLVSRRRRAAPTSQAAIRASAGALLHLPHVRVANVARALHRLKDAGFTVVGLAEDAPRSVYDEPCPPGRVALVVGSEGTGMSRLTREACDLVVSLPMRGRVGSLNAAASLAAALFAYVVPSRSP